MTIDVELAEPAFIYLVWIDSEGHVLPLYPWNNEVFEIKDLSEPPPLRRATKRIFSPLLGRTWTFGSRGGTETVLLFVRRTALPHDVQLGALLKSPPTPKFDDRTALGRSCVRPRGRSPRPWQIPRPSSYLYAFHGGWLACRPRARE